jgi:hypothetical protein
MSQRRLAGRAHALVIGGATLFFIAVWGFRWLSMGTVDNGVDGRDARRIGVLRRRA